MSFVATIAGSSALAARLAQLPVNLEDVVSLEPTGWLTEGAVDFLCRKVYCESFLPDRPEVCRADVFPVQIITLGEWEMWAKTGIHLDPMLFTDPHDAVNTSWLDAAVTFIPIGTGAHYFLAVVVEPRRYLAAVALDPASKGAGGEEVLYILNSKGRGGHDDAAKDVFRAIRLAGGVAAAPQADISSW